MGNLMMLYRAYLGWSYTIESFKSISFWYIFNPVEQIVEHGFVTEDVWSDDVGKAIDKAKKAIEFYS